jgi:hypothetical protein
LPSLSVVLLSRSGNTHPYIFYKIKNILSAFGGIFFVFGK